jgi:hypothetical protein
MVGGSLSLSHQEKNLQQVILVLQQVQQGHLNCTYPATLAINATSTVVQATTCTASSAILPCALSADAAEEIETMWFTPTSGSFTVHHSSQAAADRSFVFVVIG